MATLRSSAFPRWAAQTSFQLFKRYSPAARNVAKTTTRRRSLATLLFILFLRYGGRWFSHSNHNLHGILLTEATHFAMLLTFGESLRRKPSCRRCGRRRVARTTRLGVRRVVKGPGHSTRVFKKEFADVFLSPLTLFPSCRGLFLSPSSSLTHSLLLLCLLSHECVSGVACSIIDRNLLRVVVVFVVFARSFSMELCAAAHTIPHHAAPPSFSSVRPPAPVLTQSTADGRGSPEKHEEERRQGGTSELPIQSAGSVHGFIWIEWHRRKISSAINPSSNIIYNIIIL